MRWQMDIATGSLKHRYYNISARAMRLISLLSYGKEQILSAARARRVIRAKNSLSKSKARIYESKLVTPLGGGAGFVYSSIRLFAQFLFEYDDSVGVCPFFSIIDAPDIGGFGEFLVVD